MVSARQRSTSATPCSNSGSPVVLDDRHGMPLSENRTVPQLTIIVPACGNQYDLDNTLVSVLENQPARSEILVPHASSYQDPYDLSDEVRFVSAPGEQLIELINAGIDASRSRIVHIVRPGIEATPDWTKNVIQRFAADVSLAAVSPRLCPRSDSPSREFRGIRFLRGGAKRHVSVTAKPPRTGRFAQVWEGPSVNAAFYRRCALMSIGRFDAKLGEYFSDVDVVAKLHRSGWRCEHEPDSRLTGELPRAHRLVFVPGVKQNGCFGVTSERRGTASSLLHHAWVTAFDLACQVPRPSMLSTSMGRCWALAECLLLQRHAWESESPTEETAFPESDDNGPAQDLIPIEAARRRLRARKDRDLQRSLARRTGG